MSIMLLVGGGAVLGESSGQLLFVDRALMLVEGVSMSSVFPMKTHAKQHQCNIL